MQASEIRAQTSEDICKAMSSKLFCTTTLCRDNDIIQLCAQTCK
jgi:hypothetical protein